MKFPEYNNHLCTSLVLALAICVTVAFTSCSDDNGEPYRVYDSYGTAPAFVKAVDLGLSVKWASCNIGAASEECYGYYFAWGETAPKTEYSYGNYTYCANRYNTYSKYTEEDSLTQLEAKDDAATVNWGGNWRMPTADELIELIDSCTWTQKVVYGVNVYKVTSKKNGNYIYLPAAGWKTESSSRDEAFYGNYWTSSVRFTKGNKQISWDDRPGVVHLRFTANSQSLSYSTEGRSYGYTVRPVYQYTEEERPHEEETETDDLKAVDLGLSVKWADRNFDISANEAIQGFYGWGDPSGCVTDFSGNYAEGFNSVISGTQYDVVSQTYGGEWRIPTQNEFQELFEKCTWKYVIQNDVNGFRITRKNGNQIFIPILGSREGGNIIENTVNDGIFNHFCPGCFPTKTEDDHYFGKWTHALAYWTGTNSSNSSTAMAVEVTENGEVWHKEDEYPNVVSKDDYYYKITDNHTINFVEKNRYIGLAIRPVCK